MMFNDPLGLYPPLWARHHASLGSLLSGPAKGAFDLELHVEKLEGRSEPATGSCAPHVRLDLPPGEASSTRSAAKAVEQEEPNSARSGFQPGNATCSV